ncbi:MAG: hypothetical protein M0T70_15190 [Geobacteraceae bacterium]|nr:hypothetical protein [Geobacteraceae bacterium]
MRSTLQNGVLLLAAMLLAAGVVLLWQGTQNTGWHLVIWGLVVLIAIICERWRYRNLNQPVAGNWQRTGERFEDPETGQIVEVLFNPESGERHYAPDALPDDRTSGRTMPK